MASLDRLGWATGFAIRSYGLSIGVRVNDARLVGELLEQLPHGWRFASSNRVDLLYSVIGSRGPAETDRRSARLRRFDLLYGNETRLVRTTDRRELLESFGTSLRHYVAEFARRRVFVHAGAVGWQGRAILVPGRSFSGKTSLVAELVKAGATYYSDEFAVLDARGRLHPYLKPLSIRKPNRVAQTDVAVESLGGVSGTRALPVGLVLVSEFRPGARWRPRQLTGGQAVLSLLANAVAARRKPQDVLSALNQVVASASTFKTPRGEASDVARLILEMADD